MKKPHVSRTTFGAIALSVLALSACSTEQVANSTGDVVGAVGRGTVHVVAGAGRLAGRGVSAGYNALTDE